MHQENSSKKTIVLFMIDFIYTLTGGTENQVVKLINNLPASKYDVHLLSLRNTEWIKKNGGNLNCTIKTCNIIKLKNPLTIIQYLHIFQYIRKTKPAIVMTFFPLSNILGVIIARLAKVKVIISTRRDYGLWLNKWSIHLIRFANHFVSKIITNSNNVKELTCSKEHCSHSKVQVIYNGILLSNKNTSQFDCKELKEKHGIPIDNLIIGTVAGLRPMKRHTTIIQAAKSVLDYRKDVSFVIVGDGILRSRLETLALDLGIEKSIYFVGSQDNVLPFLSLFDIAVNSSANEGLSNAIMEYMTFGIPCVVSHAGGNSELIVDKVNGYTFELDNHNELAQRILDLLDDKEQQQLFIAESKKRIQEMSIERMIAHYDRLFTTLLTNH